MFRCFFVLFFFSSFVRALPTDEVILFEGARVAIMTGTYSPPHKRHHEIFEQLLASGQVDYVLVIPNDVTPHKPFALDPDIRLAMLKEAYRDHLRVLYPHSLKELGFPLASKTRNYLNSQGLALSWIGVMGEDSFASKVARAGAHFQKVDSWIVLSTKPVADDAPAKRLGNKPVTRLYAPTDSDVHSKEIRVAASNQDLESLNQLVLPPVAEMILQEGLYVSLEPKATKLDYLRSCLKILSKAL